MTPEELLKEVGEPVAYYDPDLDCGSAGISFDPLSDGIGLYTSDQVAAAVSKATKPIDGVAKPVGYFQVEFYGGNPMHQQVGSQYKAELGVFPLYTAEAVTVAVNQFKEQLTKAEQRVAELEAEVERLSAAHVKACQANADSQAELAAEQLNNKRLRDALQAYIDEHEECQDADDWMAMMCSVEAHHATDEALSQPSDTSALDSFVAEKVKEAMK